MTHICKCAGLLSLQNLTHGGAGQADSALRTGASGGEERRWLRDRECLTQRLDGADEPPRGQTLQQDTQAEPLERSGARQGPNLSSLREKGKRQRARHPPSQLSLPAPACPPGRCHGGLRPGCPTPKRAGTLTQRFRITARRVRRTQTPPSPHTQSHVHPGTCYRL